MRKRTKASLVPEGDESVQFPSALLRGLDILRAFTPNDETLSNLDLMDRTGLPKATVSRLCATLVTPGYLDYHEALGRYSIGAATIALGYSGLSANAVIKVATPLMQTIADEFSLTVAIGAREGTEMLYLNSCRSSSPVTMRIGAGTHLPMWRTAMGLGYLAVVDDQSRRQLLDQLCLKDRENSKLIDSTTARAVDQFKRQGFVVSLGDWYPYINAVGIPFHPTDGSPTMVLTCGGIVDIATPAVCETRIGPALRRLIIDLQSKLVGRSSASASRQPSDDMIAEE